MNSPISPLPADSILVTPTAGDPDRGPDRLVVGELVIDLRGREVSLEGRPIKLTRIEFDLLAYLAAHPGWVASPRP